MVIVSTGYAFNRTRNTYLATHVSVASTHWSRFCGLMGKNATRFPAGEGLWIVPCHGIHTFAMKFPIDVIYLDADQMIVHLEQELKPWRVAPVSLRTASVLELPASTLQGSGTGLGDEIEIVLGESRGSDTA